MRQNHYITIISNRKQIVLGTDKILYVLVNGRNTEIHVLGDKVYETRVSILELAGQLAEGFIRIHRGCLVAVRVIHDITDRVYLNNGEALEFTERRKKEIIQQFHRLQKDMIRSFSDGKTPASREAYNSCYRSFDHMPFAFTDIEMIFDEKRHAVDWIFCYGNEALARIEKMPLDELIGSSFGSLFSNMDVKWLNGYERATLYGETLELTDYSPEIDTYLKVICFPTFPGHCGCILFDIREIEYIKSSDEAEKALRLYFAGHPIDK